MKIVIEEANDQVRIVQPAGRIDLSCAFDLRGALTKQVQRGGTLIVDLQEVLFMDSSGLGALISGFKAAKKIGTGFCLMRPNRQVSYVLHSSALNRVFPIYHSREEALAAIK